jgi:organic hydroperoxide reductase OsmC/OhrA
MSDSGYRAGVRWTRTTPDFTVEGYDRSHRVSFGGGQACLGSAAPDYKGRADMVNPEELMAASLASCHMLTFLFLAARQGLTVDAYEDEAEALVGKNAEGRMAVTRIVLRPRATFAGTAPGSDELKKLHDRAHRGCFVANSLACEVAIEPAE